MTYSVAYTDSTNPAKPAITVADGTVNQQTSLSFPGQTYAGYASLIAGNMLHLLENFANSSAPNNPVQGQLWYDTSSGNNILRVYDGSGNWPEAGSIKREGKSTLTTTGGVPDVSNSNPGDLWVDTDNSQLYLFSGTTWLLIGPQFSSGLSTGPLVESIVDTANVTHSVISMYASSSSNSAAYRVAIISIDSFTPKSAINGFSTINAGINLYSNSIDQGTTYIWGTAQQSNSLVVGSGSTQTVVSGSNFLRSDVVSTTNNGFNVRNTSGISIGSDLSLTIGQGTNTFLFNSKSSTNNIDFLLNGSNLLHLDVSGKVSVGAPTTVSGSITSGVVGTAGGLAVTDGGSPQTTVFSVNNSSGVTTSLATTINNNLNLGGVLQISSSAPTGSIILPPALTNATPQYDIGSQTHPFRNIFAQSFVGSFTGNFTGTVTGSVSGTANSLNQLITFKLAGDVVSSDGGTGFNGQSATGYAVLNTQLSPTVINSQTTSLVSNTSDQFLVYQSSGSGSSGSLVSMSKAVLLQIDSTLKTSGYGVPIGVILPFAGIPNIRAIPNGWLLCDGSEVSQSTYQSLFKVIGNTYGIPQGVGTFVLPDMRGRFPLGRDNMNNLTDVTGFTQATDGSGHSINTGGQIGAAQRVSDTTADTVGGGAGYQTATLQTSNLPDHTHKLTDPGHHHIDPYAEGGVPFDVVPNTYGSAGSSATDSDQSRYYTSTEVTGISVGGVNTSTLGSAINIMNPYLTLNYIIFTGANLS